jgi:hypothetical protein
MTCGLSLILVTGEREGRVSTRVQRVGKFMTVTRLLIIEGHLERSVGSRERTTPVTSMLNGLLVTAMNISSVEKARQLCALEYN